MELRITRTGLGLQRNRRHGSAQTPGLLLAPTVTGCTPLAYGGDLKASSRTEGTLSSPLDRWQKVLGLRCRQSPIPQEIAALPGGLTAGVRCPAPFSPKQVRMELRRRELYVVSEAV